MFVTCSCFYILKVAYFLNFECICGSCCVRVLLLAFVMIFVMIKHNFVVDFMHLDNFCGRLSTLQLQLWQILFVRVFLVAFVFWLHYLWQILSLLMSELCSKINFVADFLASIAFVADFMCQGIYCGIWYLITDFKLNHNLCGSFFYEIWRMLPTEYLDWHFWLKLAFSSVTW